MRNASSPALVDEPALEVIQEDNSFWLGSADLVDLSDPEAVKGRGRVLLALASGALHVEFGRFDPPRVTAAVLVDAAARSRLRPRQFVDPRYSEINARIERTRPDGQIEDVELVADRRMG